MLSAVRSPHMPITPLHYYAALYSRTAISAAAQGCYLVGVGAIQVYMPVAAWA